MAERFAIKLSVPLLHKPRSVLAPSSDPLLEIQSRMPISEGKRRWNFEVRLNCTAKSEWDFGEFAIDRDR
jgi:hypothetical protein